MTGGAPRVDGRAVVALDEVFVGATGELFKDFAILAQSYPPGFAVERRDAAAIRRAAEGAMHAPRRLEGEWLFVTDRWSGNYYHWMCEVLARLERLGSRHPAGRLLLPAGLLRLSYVRQSLEAWPDFETEPFTTSLSVERLLVASHVAPGGQQDRDLTMRVVRRLERHFGLDGQPRGDRRVFVSRARAQKRRLANELALAPVLSRHGFETVVLEELDLRDQIALLRATRVLAGAHGAGFTNMMFMAPGGTVIELRQRAGPPDSFVNLARTCGHHHFALDCEPADPQTHVHAADLLAEPETFDALLGRVLPPQERKRPG